MQWVMGVLIFLVVLAVYCALVLSKKTDERIRHYVKEASQESPMTVRFPDEVLDSKKSAPTAPIQQHPVL